jgi:D-alanyl-D-alanine carboxypeptidase
MAHPLSFLSFLGKKFLLNNNESLLIESHAASFGRQPRGPPHSNGVRMTPRTTLLAMSLFAAGCTVTDTQRPSHETCTAAVSHSGADLRAPLPAAATRLAPEPRSGLTPAETDALDHAFGTARAETGAPSLAVAVWQSGGDPWTRSHGTPPGQLHYWASVGKIVTATAILRLAEDGRLSLEDPISAYVAGVPNGDVITLRMLLDHTSGLYSANEDPVVQSRAVPLDLEGLLEVVDRRPPYACPGAAWRYSNSGYTLLGHVIEEVTGQPYHSAATDLVLSRSAARAIRVLAPDDPLADVVGPVGMADGPALEFRTHQGAGGVVADAESMALFLRDLLAGRIASRAAVADMVEALYPMFQDGTWYGLGLMVYDVPGPAGSTMWVGHSGGVPGARAVVAFEPDHEAIVAVALTGEASAEATANLLLNALEPQP